MGAFSGLECFRIETVFKLKTLELIVTLSRPVYRIEMVWKLTVEANPARFVAYFLVNKK